jgi:hypothetical protein
MGPARGEGGGGATLQATEAGGACDTTTGTPIWDLCVNALQLPDSCVAEGPSSGLAGASMADWAGQHRLRLLWPYFW